MRHDSEYRIVLRTKQEYLYKYKLSAFILMGIFLASQIYSRRSSKSQENNFKNQLDKYRNTEEDDGCKINFTNEKILVKLHENWYFTLFDKRLFFFAVDLLNLSVRKYK
jgi:hypothetical protein